MTIPAVVPAIVANTRRKGIAAPWVRLVREGTPSAEEPVPIRDPEAARALLAPELEREEVEVFVVVLLDAQARTIGRVQVTRGILNSSLVHPREVFRIAIALNAAAIILAHNHPSGDPTPSPDDRAVTNQLVAAGRLLDIPVHDHIIIGHGGRFTSFAQAGLL